MANEDSEATIPGDDASVNEFNARAWDLGVESQLRWTMPASAQDLAKARSGELSIQLTPSRTMPPTWLPEVKNKNILALAAGGGQQGPLLAAAGAQVTVVDISKKQLDQDRAVAERETLCLSTVQASADDLSGFGDGSFDAVINPLSSCFFPRLGPVWRECARLLKPGAPFMTGFLNPVIYTFDFEKANQGHFHMKYSLPYSDLESLSEDEKKRFLRKESPLEFSHTLTEQIAGVIEAGFRIDGFYEDTWGGEDPVDAYFPVFLALRAVRT